MDFGTAAELSPASIRARAARRTDRTWAVVIALSSALFVGGVGIGIAVHWQKLRQPREKTKPTGTPTVFERMNFRFLIPTRGWKHEDRTRDQLKNARLVLHQTTPAAWFAVLVKDFRARNPRPRELQMEVVHALEGYFTENLEYEFDENEVAIHGKQSQRVRFRGQSHRQTFHGECHMFGHQGLGYWIMAWGVGDSLKNLESDFDDLRQRFSFGDERKTWEEKRPALQVFEAVKTELRLRDTEEIWERPVIPATDFDATADLVLQAREQDLSAEGDRKKNIRVAATVMVLVLPKAADLKAAVTVAREHLHAQQKKEYPETALEPLSDKERPPDQLGAIGKAQGHLGMVRVRNGETRHLLIVQAVIPRPDYTLVLQGECYWKQRAAWEGPIVELLQSVQFGTEEKRP